MQQSISIDLDVVFYAYQRDYPWVKFWVHYIMVIQLLPCMQVPVTTSLNRSMNSCCNCNCNIFTGSPLSKTDFQWSPAHTYKYTHNTKIVTTYITQNIYTKHN